MANQKFISLVKWLRKNWSVTANIPYGYVGIDNKITQITVEMPEEKRKEFLRMLVQGNATRQMELNKRFSGKDPSGLEFNKAYSRETRKRNARILLKAHKEGLLS